MQSRAKYFLFASIFLNLTGCDLFGDKFVKPGETVKIISVTRDMVVLKYTHSYSSELQAATNIADLRCQEFGTHAVLTDTTKISIDRSTATFGCK